MTNDGSGVGCSDGGGAGELGVAVVIDGAGAGVVAAGVLAMVGTWSWLPDELPSSLPGDCWLAEALGETGVLGEDVAWLVALAEPALFPVGSWTTFAAALFGPQPASATASPAPATPRARPPARSLRLPGRRLGAVPPPVTWYQSLGLIPGFPPGRNGTVGVLSRRSTFSQAN